MVHLQTTLTSEAEKRFKFKTISKPYSRGITEDDVSAAEMQNSPSKTCLRRCLGRVGRFMAHARESGGGAKMAVAGICSAALVGTSEAVINHPRSPHRTILIPGAPAPSNYY